MLCTHRAFSRALDLRPTRFLRVPLILTCCASASLCGCGETPAPQLPEPIVSSGTSSVGSSGGSARVASDQAATASAPTASSPKAAAAAAVDTSAWKTSGSADDPTVVEVAGLRAPKPAEWIWTKPTVQFRTLQYAVPGEGDSTKQAELIVSVFLAGDGGPLDANIERWRGQFRVGEKAPEAKRTQKQIGPLKVELVELEGEYLAMGAPAPKKDQMQLAAIVQASGRNVFFRIIGPKETIEKNRSDFMKMIDGLMPAD
jgi:hypothetical protein